MPQSSHSTARATATAGAGAGPLAAFGVLALIWGYNWVVMKIGVSYAGPIDFAMARTGLGALVLFGVVLVVRAPLAPRHVGKTVLLGLFQTAGFVGLVSSSLVLGAAGKTAVLAYTMPFWLIAINRWFLGERLRAWQWPAVGLAFLGLVLVLEPWASRAGLASSALALGAGISWAVSVVVFAKIPIANRHELLSLTTWQMTYGLIPLVVAAAVVPERAIEWTPAFIGALAYNAIGAMAIASLLWLYILNRLPATISGLSSLIVPLIGVVAAWLQLGERPSPAEGAGMLLIVVALGLLAIKGRAEAEIAPQE